MPKGRTADMDQPLISCIVPVFNGERYLAEALNSIITQSYKQLEIIVADDGSSDGTTDIVAAYSGRVRYLLQPNKGPAAARNLGLSASRGDFIAFLDADDLWHREKLERQMARFVARPQLDYCVTYIQNFWAPAMEEERKRFASHRISEPLPGYVTQTILARRSVFETVGEFDSALRHGDGTEWFLRATECGVAMEILPDVLVRRRMHDQNLSRACAASREEYLKIVKSSLDRRRGLDRQSSETCDSSRSCSRG
jgi:glycosyltransferase involved in cell wall biosynthesis